MRKILFALVVCGMMLGAVSSGSAEVGKGLVNKPRTADSPGNCCPAFTGTIGCGQMDDGRFFVIFYCFCADMSGNVQVVYCQ